MSSIWSKGKKYCCQKWHKTVLFKRICNNCLKQIFVNNYIPSSSNQKVYYTGIKQRNKYINIMTREIRLTSRFIADVLHVSQRVAIYMLLADCEESTFRSLKRWLVLLYQKLMHGWKMKDKWHNNLWRLCWEQKYYCKTRSVVTLCTWP